jgi:hypothetical protein|tara:strand:- start:9666 stop:10487 length:822 start_codon:yes stop_codon:yes gene_type:complete
MIMYQDNIAQETKGALSSKNQLTNNQSAFETFNLDPMGFTPHEFLCDPTHTARDILSTRSNDDVIKLSKHVSLMLSIGDGLLHQLAVKLLSNSEHRKSISLSKGRSLYLLCDYFDLDSIPLRKVHWSELFATLTLMLSAEVSYMQTQTFTDFELSVGMDKTIDHSINVLSEEIIDTITRAECLFDKNKMLSKSGSAGGEAKAKRIEPLKVEVINRFLTNYTDYSNKKAGDIIEAELISENHELLALSEAEEKNHQFSKWIGSFKNGKWKMPLL